MQIILGETSDYLFQMEHHRVVMLTVAGNSVMHVRAKTKHDIVLTKKAALFKVVHVIVVLVKSLNLTLFYQVKVFHFISPLDQKLPCFVNLTLDVHHELSNNLNVHCILSIISEKGAKKLNFIAEDFLQELILDLRCKFLEVLRLDHLSIAILKILFSLVLPVFHLAVGQKLHACD